MTIRSGLGSTWGIAREVAYGTFVAPTRWTEFQTEGLEKRPVRAQSNGIRGGSLYPRASRRRTTHGDAGGPLTFRLPTKGAGLYVEQMLGSSAVATQIGATAAYKQVHQPGSLYGKSFSAQKGVVGTADGVMVPFSYPGCRVTGWTLTGTLEDPLSLELTIDARDERTDIAYTPANYLTDVDEFVFREGVIKLGGTASTVGGVTSITGGTTVAVVKAFTLGQETTQALARYFLGQGGLKGNPIEEDVRAATGSLTAEFDTQATIYDAFTADADVSLQLTYTGALIASGNYFSVDIVVPLFRFDGGTPKVGGPGLVDLTAPFTVLDDETNPVQQWTIVSTDTAV